MIFTSWIKAPANSSDLNPIEWLWADLKIRLENSEFKPKTAEEINILIRICVSNLTIAKCRKYIQKLVKAIKTVIEKHGDWSNC